LLNCANPQLWAPPKPLWKSRGWDHGKSGVQRIAGPLGMPGCRLNAAQPWTIEPVGQWRANGVSR